MELINSFDKAVIQTVHHLPAALHWPMIAITNIFSPAVCIVVLLITMAISYHYKKGSLLKAEALLLLAQPLATILKVLTKRVRPDTVYVEHMVIKSYSFPSGHAYASLLVLGFLAYLAHVFMRRPWNRIVPVVLALLIFLVGLSRVYLGAHFPSDVLAGWLLGAAILAWAIKLSRPRNLQPRFRKI